MKEEKNHLIRLIQICNFFGIDAFDRNEKNDRKIQHLFYFLKIFGLQTQYNFHWYKDGPYCYYLKSIHMLTKYKDYYNSEDKENILTEEDQKIIQESAPFLDKLLEDPRTMNLCAKVAYLKSDMVNIDGIHGIPKKKKELLKKVFFKQVNNKVEDISESKKAIELLESHGLIR